MRVFRGKVLVVFVASLALLAGACSSGDKSSGASAACKPKDDERPAKAILRCTEASVAFIENLAATGTAVLIESGGKSYALTNAHVVHPESHADLTFSGRTIEDVPVLGLDAAADIAVLGPLTNNDLPKPLPIADGLDIERGDDLFLVGYPGESESDDLEATIASGIASRVRTVKEFDQTYIQTDASIGDGQSGGPLFDGDGNLVGISGLSFAENFALALSGRDVKKAVANLITTKGDDYLPIPSAEAADEGTTNGTVHIFDAGEAQVLFLPPASIDRTWHLKVEQVHKPVVVVENYIDGEPMAISKTASSMQQQLARELGALRGGKLPEVGDLGTDPNLAKREIAPGSFEIPVKADDAAQVSIAALFTDTPVDITWTSDLALTAASLPVVEKQVKVGDQIDIVLGAFDTAVDALVPLTAGQRVELYARSPQGDVGFAVFTPEMKLGHLTMVDPQGAGVEFYDDTDDGLYGVDAKTTYEAKTAGTYRIRLALSDGQFSLLRFSIKDCTKITCGKAKPPESPSE